MKLTFSLLVVFSFVNNLFSQTDKQIADKPNSDKNLTEYVGVYTLDQYFKTAIIEIKEGKLYATVDENGTNLLNAMVEEDNFQSTSSYGTIFSFKRDKETKEINTVILKAMGQEITGVKQKKN